MSRFVIGLINAYRYAVSPLVGAHCRFTPSCSEYAVIAFEKHAFCRAARLSLARILRCHPWRAGGYDPLP